MARSNIKTQIRGQVTVIIIIAVFMIAIFLTMNYISSNRIASEGEQSKQRQRLTQTSMEPIKTYVTSCLELATKEGLELIGAQGGNLFESQGGMIPDFEDADYGAKFARHEEQIISYAIFAPKPGYTTAGFFYSDVPMYPYETFPELGDPVRKFYGGNFGSNKLINPFPPWENNAEAQLEYYIANRLKECVEWDTFEQQNLNIKTGEATVNVTLARDETIAQLEYPINITEQTTGITGELKEFRTSAPVRLRYLLEFMNLLTDKEVSLANHTVSTARRRGITTQIIEDIHDKDYIIILKDTESSILDKAYIFQFMVHNRPPALHIINNTEVAEEMAEFIVCSVVTEEEVQLPSVLRITSDNKFIIENPTGCEHETLEIQLNSTEPDEQNVTYIFSNNVIQNQNKGPQEVPYTLAHKLEDRRKRGGSIDEGWLKVNITVNDGILADNQVYHFKTHTEKLTS